MSFPGDTCVDTTRLMRRAPDEHIVAPVDAGLTPAHAGNSDTSNFQLAQIGIASNAELEAKVRELGVVPE
ncbi:hypothetical protein F8O06_00240 [Pseudoclavibacter sp. CFCC 14310]|uniref:hypothetical protein n=1 Tax=Pseudoclavibacter sp. CFCC 14310 TaxID=2615180 RepID=UPI0013012000|nr:hypothetical protein [Pseudoclavibacter sp. CFCC 14310]KAB1647055.1 hypothetical protein F8O06_00240 [Pseudoclavibacter sp. CFCC 14310]